MSCQMEQLAKCLNAELFNQSWIVTNLSLLHTSYRLDHTRNIYMILTKHSWYTSILTKNHILNFFFFPTTIHYAFILSFFIKTKKNLDFSLIFLYFFFALFLLWETIKSLFITGFHNINILQTWLSLSQEDKQWVNR